MFGILDANLNTGVFRSKFDNSVWLFITEKKSKDLTQYTDLLDGNNLTWDGQMSGRSDELIRTHKPNNLDLLVFYRKEKRQFDDYSFVYEGPFEYVSDRGSGPTHFTFKRVVVLEQIVASDLDSLKLEEGIIGLEGGQIKVYGTRYERDKKLRAKAIQLRGRNCEACGFNFEQMYGTRGADYIEVHHTKPISSFTGKQMVDPMTDMAVVCSNCHRMIHRNAENILSVAELRELIFNASRD